MFGLSAGAVIALETARSSAPITRLALYEPPLSFDGVSHTAWVARYERELAAGRLAAALVTIMKGTAGHTTLRYLPGCELACEWSSQEPGEVDSSSSSIFEQ